MSIGTTEIAILVLSFAGVALGAYLLLFQPFKLRSTLRTAPATAYGKSISLFIVPVLSLVGVIGGAVFLLSIYSVQTVQKPPYSKVTEEPRAPIAQNYLPDSFESRYTFKEFLRPKPRFWQVGSDGIWRENYDKDQPILWGPVGAMDLEGCSGLLLKKLGHASEEAFIPSLGCKQILRYRRGDGPWHEIGPIEHPTRATK